ATGQVSPVELAEACLARIQRLDGRLHCFITLLAEEALAAARKAEAAIVEGEYLGPLHGIPIGLKDLYWTRGVLTTAGSKVMADFTPQEDAETVARLKDAGSVILGKLNMHPFAYGAVGVNPDYGTPPNPWDATRIPGGSSSGSGVGLAAGLFPGATGSDTGGSIRIPASLCGVAGIKPTAGRVSRHGLVPLSWSLDHAGPMARCVEDCAILLEAMAGHDAKDEGTTTQGVPDYRATLRSPVRGLRAGLPRPFYRGLQAGVRSAVEAAVRVLEELGVWVQEVDAPSLEETGPLVAAIMGPEVAAYHQDMLKTRSQDYPEDVLRRIMPNFEVPAVEYVKAQRARASVTQRYLELLGRYDLLVTPTEPITAMVLGQTTVTIEGQERTTQGLLTRFTNPFNLTGLPAMSVPCGFDEAHLPVGLQIVGRPFEEATVLRAAYAYEQATPWHQSKPDI
ncbi:MAG: Asp-tRNA(Asn)/Glu-tRNA(Gln) amidotransferase subunit GatA, partial [Chloroflexi bacterium]|nr:Asp-tRNA(Asn)/Glu-tRNA(Gln) amidotransferase subunit GatA [Chloroflexota bacterium]